MTRRWLNYDDDDDYGDDGDDDYGDDGDDDDDLLKQLQPIQWEFVCYISCSQI